MAAAASVSGCGLRLRRASGAGAGAVRGARRSAPPGGPTAAIMNDGGGGGVEPSGDATGTIGAGVGARRRGGSCAGANGARDAAFAARIFPVLSTLGSAPVLPASRRKFPLSSSLAFSGAIAGRRAREIGQEERAALVAVRRPS